MNQYWFGIVSFLYHLGSYGGDSHFLETNTV